MQTATTCFFDASEDFLCIAGIDGLLHAVNPAMASLLGYSSGAAELVKTPLAELIHEDDRELFREELERAKGGARTSFASRIRAADGSYKPLHWSGTASPEQGLVYFVTRYVAVPPAGEGAPAAGVQRRDDEFFVSLVRHLAAVLGVQHAFVAHCVDWPVTRVSTLGGWMFGKPCDNFVYPLAGTPCEKVLSGEACYFPSGVQQDFADDKFLIDIGCQSYLGAPLLDSAGALLGHICVLDDKPMKSGDRAWQSDVIHTFAGWAVTELERVHAEEAFRKVMEATASLSGVELLQSLARHIAGALQTRYALIAEYMGDPPARARALAFWNGDGCLDGFDYDLDGTPCALVAKGEARHYADGIQQSFPRDQRLADLKAKSYLGIALESSSGRRIGQLIVIDTEPMPASPRRTRLLRLFAGRAATLIEQMRSAALAEQNELRFNLVVENAADAIFVYDRRGVLLDVNRAARESLGYGREELVGMNIEAIRCGLAERAIAREVEALKPGVAVTSEQQMRRRDGTSFDVEVRTVLFELGTRPLVLTLARDITDRKRAEEKLREVMRAMSTPIIQAWDGIVVMPVIGAIDEARTAQMTEALLSAIARTGAGYAVLDLTGVQAVDASTADHVLKMVRATSLLGSQCLISGISPDIAGTLVGLGVEVSGLSTFGTLQSALKFAIGRTAASSSGRNDKPAFQRR